MRMLTRVRPSPAMVIACVALSVALAGSAVAGTSAVSNKLTKSKVKKIAKKQANKAITKRAPGLSVAHAATADNASSATNVAASEGWHVVGDSGEPSFGNGGENDCLWSSSSDSLPDVNPVAFYKDKLGNVHFAGLAVIENGPGGDGLCDDIPDLTAFTLPDGYRPDNVEFQATTDGGDPVIFIIGADHDVNLGGTIPIPAGAVVDASAPAPDSFAFDGQIEFRAAGTGSGFSASADTSSSVPPGPIRDALKRLGG